MQRDGFKRLNELFQVDERNLHFVRINLETLEHRRNSLEAHYADIAKFALHSGVPELIATQYDVARNIYIYAWYEYRFYNVAEANVLSTLELALKERIGEVEIDTYIKSRRKAAKNSETKDNPRQGLKTLMEYCRDHDLVSNNGFRAWHSYPMRQARLKFEQDKFLQAKEEIQKTGKSNIPVEPYIAEYIPPDDIYNHIQHLIDHVNKARNTYAHGSGMLHPAVLGTFEMVSEFINQLYPIPTPEVCD